MSGDIDRMAGRLHGLMQDRLGLGGATLGDQLRRTGRRAPRRVRRDLRAVVEALELSHHPRLCTRIPRNDVEAAGRRAEIWLKEQDPEARRAQAWRAMMAGLAFNLLLASGIGIALLAGTGLIGP